MIYEYWLAGIKEITDLKKQKLREVYGSGKAIYYIEETKLDKLRFLNEKDVAILKNAKKDTELEEKWRRTEEKRIQFIPYFLKTYPEKLKYITDPPYALYVLGQLPDEKRKSAAIVGARNCTAYGEQMALQYGKSLAEAGIQIISGMARGIDGAGQRGALNSSWAKESGVTYAVLGCGVDVCYPRENIGLYMDIQEKGGTPYADHIQNPCRSLCAGADPACGRALVPAESFRWFALHPRVGAGAAECPDAVCGERHFHGDRGAADGVCHFALWPACAGRMAACQAGRAERLPAGLHHGLSSGHGGQKMQKTAADPIRRLSYGKEGCLRPQPTSNPTSGPISGRPCKA